MKIIDLIVSSSNVLLKKKNTISHFLSKTYLTFIILIKLFKRFLESYSIIKKKKRTKNQKKEHTQAILLNYGNTIVFSIICNMLRITEIEKGKNCLCHLQYFFFSDNLS